MGLLRNHRERRQVKDTVKRDSVLLNGWLAAYSEQVGAFEPEFGAHHVSAGSEGPWFGQPSSLLRSAHESLRAKISARSRGL